MSEGTNIIPITPEVRKKKHLLRWVGGIIIVVLVGVFAVIGSCKTKKITISGTTHYTKEEVWTQIKKKGYIGNSVLYYLRNKIAPAKILPFVSSMDVSIESRNSIHITIHEKKRAGCIFYNQQYVYFDNDGNALEIHNKKYEDVPLVKGLQFKKIKIGEKIPVKNHSVFSYVLKLTVDIEKYKLNIQEICFRQGGDTTLTSGKLTIDLHSKENIDLKLSELTGILDKMKGRSGIIDIKYLDDERKIITFNEKNS